MGKWATPSQKVVHSREDLQIELNPRELITKLMDFNNQSLTSISTPLGKSNFINASMVLAEGL